MQYFETAFGKYRPILESDLSNVEIKLLHLRFLGVLVVFDNVRVIFSSEFTCEAEIFDWCCKIQFGGVLIFSIRIYFVIGVHHGCFSISIRLFIEG